MTTSPSLPESDSSSSRGITRRERLIWVWSFATVAVLGTVALGVTAAASDPDKRIVVMQESLVSHGVVTDDETAERVSKQCSYDGRTVTVDLIAEFGGSQQIVAVQCTDAGTISAVSVRVPLHRNYQK